MKRKIKKLKVKSNGLKNTDLKYDIQHLKKPSTKFFYSIYLVSMEHQIIFLLHKHVSNNILKARKAAMTSFQIELERLIIQPETPLTQKLGLILSFEPSHYSGKILVMESSFEELKAVTEENREKEKTIFLELGNEYPERNFD